MATRVYLSNPTNPYPTYKLVQPNPDKLKMLEASKEGDLFIFDNKVYEVTHNFDSPVEIEQDVILIYLKPVTFEKEEQEGLLKFKTERTKRILSTFNSDEIQDLIQDEKDRRPAQGSKLAGLDQQEE